MRQGVPLYELPRSVIDLDAEDNRHVRPYDEAVDGPPEEDKWADAHASIDALRDRITDLEYEIEQSRKRMLETASKPTAWRILDRDILSAALLGPQKYKEPTEGATAGPETRTAPRIVPNDEASVLAEVLYRNGISPRQAFQQVPLLLHREEKARMQFGIGDWKSLSGVLYGCQSVLEARRILGLAVQTAEGRTGILVDSKRIAHLLGSFIEKAQQEAAKAATATAGNDLVDTVRQVSELLLNLSHALASVADLVEQEDNGAPLWAVGLWASALASEPAAMQRFLRLGVAFGNAEDVSQFMSVYSSNRAEASRREPPAVVLALHTVLLQLQRSPMAFANTRSDLFTMLTACQT
ncbi:aldehyde dehydrogenase (NADP(+)) ald6 [Sporothrix eucalyptigena]